MPKHIIYYCLRVGKECFEDYIDSLDIIDKKIFYTTDSELDPDLFNDQNSIHIFRYHLPHFLRDTTVKERIFILNTEQMSEPLRKKHILGLVAQGFGIIDYSLVNINILKQYTNNLFYIPYQYRAVEIDQLRLYNNQPAKYDVGIVACTTRHRQNILEKLRQAGFRVLDVRGWGADRDRQIGQCKILFNAHYGPEFKIFEHIRCDRWLFAGKPVVSEPVDCLDLLDVKDTIIFANDIDQRLLDAGGSTPSPELIKARYIKRSEFLDHLNKL